MLAHGLAAASLRPLAKAVGTSDRMLLDYFPDKTALIGAILETIAARLSAQLVPPADAVPQPFDALRRQLTTAMLDDALWPYMRLWLEIASQSAAGDRICRQTGEAIARGFLAMAASLLDSPDQETRRRDATRLLIAVEGAVLLRSLGLAEEVRQTL